jgi:hypothetical protein
MGLEFQMDRVTEERDAGGLPADRIHDVRYGDLVADPTGTVRVLYDEWGLEVSPAFEANLTAYLADRHTGRSGGHDYRFEDTGLDLAEHRERLRGYQDRFGVPSEV